MSIKRVLKFYFYADGYSRLLDWKIAVCVKNSAFRGGEESAEEMCSLLEDKEILSEYWEYLDGVLENFDIGERKVLKFYSSFRHGGIKLTASERAEIKRCTVKFRRRARRLESFSAAYEIAAKLACAVR